MICTFTGEEITGFDSYWLEPGEFSAKKQETISAAAALIAYMSEKEGDEEVHISEIELVYWVNSASYDSMEAVTDTALPTWRITLSLIHIYRCRREKGVVYADYVPVLGKEIHKTDDEHYGGVLYVDYKVVRYLRHNVS